MVAALPRHRLTKPLAPRVHSNLNANQLAGTLPSTLASLTGLLNMCVRFPFATQTELARRAN